MISPTIGTCDYQEYASSLKCSLSPLIRSAPGKRGFPVTALSLRNQRDIGSILLQSAPLQIERLHIGSFTLKAGATIAVAVDYTDVRGLCIIEVTILDCLFFLVEDTSVSPRVAFCMSSTQVQLRVD